MAVEVGPQKWNWMLPVGVTQPMLEAATAAVSVTEVPGATVPMELDVVVVVVPSVIGAPMTIGVLAVASAVTGM